MAEFRQWMESQDDFYNDQDWDDGEFDAYDNDSGMNYWGNIGAGVLPIARKTGRILLNYRSAYVNEGNTWGVWGGKVDDEDTLNLEEEAKREFAEEAGYTGPIQLTPAYIFKTTGFEYHNYIGIIPDEFEPNIPPQHQWETEDYRWVTWEELLEIEPKHFGLTGLVQHSGQIIQRLAKPMR